MSRPAQRGQASVELLALVPAIVLLGLLVWQAVAAAHAWQVAGSAARAGARAAEVGAPAEDAARAVLPSGYARGARVRTDTARSGRATVRVTVEIASVLPGLPSPAAVTGSVEVGP